MTSKLTVGAVLALSLAMASTSASAGNLGKKFGSSATPPPPKSATTDFNAAKGSTFKYDSPSPSLTPSGSPSVSNATPSVAVPLTTGFTTVGKVR